MLFGFSPEIIMRNDAYIGGRSESNINCIIVHDDLWWKNQTTISCRVTGFKSDFLSFIVVELIRFFHGALQFISVQLYLTQCVVAPGGA